MIPRAIAAGRVFAMARPRRPATEAEIVRAALAGQAGTAAQRARRLALAVAELALRDVDGDPGDRVLLLLGALDASPAAKLATDPQIDTAAMIRSERAQRMEARSWRRLPEREWNTEDRQTVAAVADTLAKRYARYLCRFQS